MPVDTLTKDDVTKSNAALNDLIHNGRLLLVDEGAEIAARKNDPKTKDRSHAASKKRLLQEESSYLTALTGCL